MDNATWIELVRAGIRDTIAMLKAESTNSVPVSNSLVGTELYERLRRVNQDDYDRHEYDEELYEDRHRAIDSHEPDREQRAMNRAMDTERRKACK